MKIKNGEAILGDCLEEMKKMDSESVDMILTSPPYDNLRTYNGSLKWSFDIFSEIAKECARVIKKGGVIVWVVGDATIKGSETGTSFRQALYFKDECGLNLHDTMIWFKDACRFPDKVRYYDSFEYMFVFSKGKPKSINQIADKKNKWGGSIVHGTNRMKDSSTKRLVGHNKKQVKEFGVRYNMWLQHNPGKKGNVHPATFPEKLAEDHIISWSNEGDMILDPFAGAFTTGKMAELNNRKWICIEKDETYFNIGINRLGKHSTDK